MTTIRITDLSLKTIIGTHPWERIIKQKVIINITLEYDSSQAIQTDNIDRAVDYKAITKKIISEAEQSRYFLLESLTHHILRLIMTNKNIRAVTVRVDKPGALRFARSVSAELIARQ